MNRRRSLVDTGVLVRGQRRGALPGVSVADDVGMAAVTLAELLVGVELADEAHRAARGSFVAGIRAIIPVVPYDGAVIDAHAILLAHVRRDGTPRGAHDLLIAATAIATDRTLVTTDRAARFDGLPGLRVEIV